MLKLKLNWIILIFIALSSIKKINAQNSTIQTTGDVLVVAIPAIAFGTTLILADNKGT